MKSSIHEIRHQFQIPLCSLLLLFYLILIFPVIASLDANDDNYPIVRYLNYKLYEEGTGCSRIYSDVREYEMYFPLFKVDGEQGPQYENCFSGSIFPTYYGYISRNDLSFMQFDPNSTSIYMLFFSPPSVSTTSISGNCSIDNLDYALEFTLDTCVSGKLLLSDTIFSLSDEEPPREAYHPIDEKDYLFWHYFIESDRCKGKEDKTEIRKTHFRDYGVQIGEGNEKIVENFYYACNRTDHSRIYPLYDHPSYSIVIISASNDGDCFGLSGSEAKSVLYNCEDTDYYKSHYPDTRLKFLLEYTYWGTKCDEEDIIYVAIRKKELCQLCRYWTYDFDKSSWVESVGSVITSSILYDFTDDTRFFVEFFNNSNCEGDTFSSGVEKMECIIAVTNSAFFAGSDDLSNTPLRTRGTTLSNTSPDCDENIITSKEKMAEMVKKIVVDEEFDLIILFNIAHCIDSKFIVKYPQIVNGSSGRIECEDLESSETGIELHTEVYPSSDDCLTYVKPSQLQGTFCGEISTLNNMNPYQILKVFLSGQMIISYFR